MNLPGVKIELVLNDVVIVLQSKSLTPCRVAIACACLDCMACAPTPPPPSSHTHTHTHTHTHPPSPLQQLSYHGLSPLTEDEEWSLSLVPRDFTIKISNEAVSRLKFHQSKVRLYDNNLCLVVESVPVLHMAYRQLHLLPVITLLTTG